VVVVDPVLPTLDHQQQDLDPGQVRLHLAGRLIRSDLTGVGQLLAVAQDPKHHAAGLAADLIVHADHGRKSCGPAVQLDPQRAVRVGPESLLEGLAPDPEGIALHRAVGPRVPPALLDLRHIQITQRHHLCLTDRAQDREDQEGLPRME